MLSSTALQTRPCSRCVGRWVTGTVGRSRHAAFHVTTTTVPGSVFCVTKAVRRFSGSAIRAAWADTTASRLLRPLSPVNNGSLPNNVSLEQGVKFSRQGCHAGTGFLNPKYEAVRSHTTRSGARPQAQRQARKEEDLDRGWVQPEGNDTGIKIYNSLTRKKEPLILPNGRVASWYACGPTVYDHAHIGHASAYVRTDIIRRILMNHFNIDVVMVMGVTDIDDKIIKRSKELSVQPRHLTRTYENEFFKDMEALNIMAPTVKTRVTEHIPQILKFVQRLIDNGSAYKTPSGSVYFDVQQYGRYGRLWTHSLDTVIRDALDKDKRSPRDFALWKAAKPDEPSWASEWGQGRPGWHIECSTMASAIFGEQLDLHSGGEDLRFPHHENEMAQSEACFCTQQWTNYWLHTGHLHLKNDENKMSKSLKNTVWVSELLAHTSANEFRVFCMLRPYRQLIEYSADSLQKAVRIYNMWTSFISLAEAYVKGKVHAQAIDEPFLLQSLEETKFKVERALADDFDTPKAMYAIEELIKKANIELGRKVDSEVEFVSRSPGVIAAILAYVQRVLDMWGVHVSKQTVSGQTGAEQRFKAVMDGVINFRSEVRGFALNPKKHLSVEDMAVCENHTEDQLSDKERKKLELRKVKPLLEACDNLRDDLKVAGITIQDHAKSAGWVLEEKNIPKTFQKK